MLVVCAPKLLFRCCRDGDVFGVLIINFNIMSKLTIPTFVKVNSLVDARNGYNVYVRVVKAEESKSNDGQSTFVRAVVADETGSANAFFKGESAKLIKEGAVIAIRNGRIRIIKDHISLEIDIFGRITPENLDIKANTKENISDKVIERRRRERRGDGERRDREERPRRNREDRDNGERRPREERERRPREDREERAPREDRRPREDREERRPR